MKTDKTDIGSEHHSKHCRTIAKEGASIFRIKQGRFWTDAHLNMAIATADGRVIPQASLAGNPFKAHDFNAGNELFLPVCETSFNDIFIKCAPVHYTESIACLASFGSSRHNFGHWFTDTLPMLYMLWGNWPRQTFSKYYFPSFQQPWQMQTAQMLGIQPEQVIDGTNIINFSCDELFCTSFPRPNWNMPSWIPKAVKSLFTPFKNSFNAGPKIYISRKDSTTRRPTNEDELSEALQTCGFRELVMSDLSLRSQISAFANAEVVVSLHSSSLALTMFSPPGSQVVEIFGPGQVSNLHRDIARANKLKYVSMTYTNKSDIHNGEFADLNLVHFPVDTKALINLLSKAMRTTSSQIVE